jgi:hypothetical protein
MPTNYAQQVEPIMSALDYTMDKIDSHGGRSKFVAELDAALAKRDGELVEFERLEDPDRDDQGFAFAAIYMFTIGGFITLEQDDTPGAVRRKIAAELRELALRVLTVDCETKLIGGKDG